jgi:hypothetical protein
MASENSSFGRCFAELVDEIPSKIRHDAKEYAEVCDDILDLCNQTSLEASGMESVQSYSTNQLSRALFDFFEDFKSVPAFSPRFFGSSHFFFAQRKLVAVSKIAQFHSCFETRVFYQEHFFGGRRRRRRQFARVSTHFYLVPSTCTFFTCPNGSTGTSTTTECMECPAGTMKAEVGYNRCIACENGAYAVAGMANCTECPTGKYHPSTSGQCRPCEVGHIQVLTGQTKCSKKPQYHFLVTAVFNAFAYCENILHHKLKESAAASNAYILGSYTSVMPSIVLSISDVTGKAMMYALPTNATAINRQPQCPANVSQQHMLQIQFQISVATQTDADNTRSVLFLPSMQSKLGHQVGENCPSLCLRLSDAAIISKLSSYTSSLLVRNSLFRWESTYAPVAIVIFVCLLVVYKCYSPPAEDVFRESKAYKQMAALCAVFGTALACYNFFADFYPNSRNFAAAVGWKTCTGAHVSESHKYAFTALGYAMGIDALLSACVMSVELLFLYVLRKQDALPQQSKWFRSCWWFWVSCFLIDIAVEAYTLLFLFRAYDLADEYLKESTMNYGCFSEQAKAEITKLEASLGNLKLQELFECLLAALTATGHIVPFFVQKLKVRRAFKAREKLRKGPRVITRNAMPGQPNPVAHTPRGGSVSPPDSDSDQ